MKNLLGRSVLIVLLSVSTSAFAGHRFHASAFAVAGEDRTAVASVALPSTGGVNESVVRDFNDGFVRFAEARTVVRGLKEGNVAVTTTKIIITDLLLGDRVHVDRLVARTNGRQSPDMAEADIDFEGSALEGLTVDGTRVDVNLDTRWFAEHPTFASIRAAGFESPAGTATITCSAYERASCEEGPRVIRIAGLGSLTIGAVHVKNGTRALEMLRLDRSVTRPGRIRTLDDTPPPLVIGGVEGNGTPVYP